MDILSVGLVIAVVMTIILMVVWAINLNRLKKSIASLHAGIDDLWINIDTLENNIDRLS